MASRSRGLALLWATMLLIQFPATIPMKADDYGPSDGGPTTDGEDKEKGTICSLEQVQIWLLSFPK